MPEPVLEHARVCSDEHSRGRALEINEHSGLAAWVFARCVEYTARYRGAPALTLVCWWHRPATLRELLAAEVAEGVVQPARLAEGSAALSLLWSMRMKRFWTRMADGFADQASTEPTSAFGLRAYEAEVEPYHGFLLRRTFRTALRALPSRAEMLGNMAMAPPPDSAARWPAWEELRETWRTVLTLASPWRPFLNFPGVCRGRRFPHARRADDGVPRRAARVLRAHQAHHRPRPSPARRARLERRPKAVTV